MTIRLPPKMSSRIGDRKPEIVAKYPGHLWHIDLTVVPTADGLAAPWHPFALHQTWPFCWWVALVVDHFSRCAMGFGIFTKEPTSEEVKQWFADLVETTGVKPKHLTTDQGSQFTGSAFVNWCKNPMNDVQQRFGAVGRYGSVAVVERAILSMKNECTRRIVLQLDIDHFSKELDAWFTWFNEYRPHTKLSGKTPNEVRFSRNPANEQPRIEPRAKWTPKMKCARPHAAIRGDPGDSFTVRVDYHRGRRHLPIISVAHTA